jgi:hypothetical protein
LISEQDTGNEISAVIRRSGRRDKAHRPLGHLLEFLVAGIMPQQIGDPGETNVFVQLRLQFKRTKVSAG